MLLGSATQVSQTKVTEPGTYHLDHSTGTPQLVKRFIRDLNSVLDIEKELKGIEKASENISTSDAKIRKRRDHLIESARQGEQLLTHSLDGTPIDEIEWKSLFDESD